MRFLKIITNAASTQAYGCLICIHIGSIALLFGKRHGPCLFRLELFTPCRKLRISTIRKKV